MLKFPAKKTQFHQNDTLVFSIENRKGVAPDSISYTLKENPIQLKEQKLPLTNVPLGIHSFTAAVFHDGKKEVLTSKFTVLSMVKPKVYTIKIIQEYPHDQGAYTQGLEFYKDTLYEGTGRYNESRLRKLNLETGEVLKEISLQQNQFGEGITILNDKIYQLTWQNKIGFVYDINTFEKIKSFSYKKSKEGWGLTNDGEKLFKSDGTEKIWILDSETLEEQDYIQVTSNSKIYNKVNELEYVDGKIYANSYQNDGIMIIDASSGALLGVVDGRGLKKKVASHSQLDVLNGIAYNPSRKTFFLTGKYWNKMFEVVFEEKN
ncbi:glutaminyl-peptide cyclotransferase [Ascidiimonas sp. W6]|uniref:glutaminyl-peptide cyclotransferase n=1 Tax=Ascidiimonas meishanensis TaxID=3128903 RepID=UPI0030EB2285